MKINLLKLLLIVGLVFPPVAALLSGTLPAFAALSIGDEFRAALAPYGTWKHSRHWGDVWIPARLAQRWRHYTVGRWITQMITAGIGYLKGARPVGVWVTFLYGHWVNEGEFGWVWIPGTEWGPGWVQWRRGGGSVGWAPLPPETGYFYRPELWVFVREQDLVAPYIAEAILSPDRVYFKNTVLIERAEDPNQGYAINRGIPPETVAALYGRPIPHTRCIPASLRGLELGLELL
jgi:hypothetical protein